MWGEDPWPAVTEREGLGEEQADAEQVACSNLNLGVTTCNMFKNVNLLFKAKPWAPLLLPSPQKTLPKCLLYSPKSVVT